MEQSRAFPAFAENRTVRRVRPISVSLPFDQIGLEFGQLGLTSANSELSSSNLYSDQYFADSALTSPGRLDRTWCVFVRISARPGQFRHVGAKLVVHRSWPAELTEVIDRPSPVAAPSSPHTQAKRRRLQEEQARLFAEGPAQADAAMEQAVASLLSCGWSGSLGAKGEQNLDVLRGIVVKLVVLRGIVVKLIASEAISTNLVRLRRTLHGHSPNWARCWPVSAECWSKFGQTWSSSGQVRPNTGQVCPTWARFGEHRRIRPTPKRC